MKKYILLLVVFLFISGCGNKQQPIVETRVVTPDITETEQPQKQEVVSLPSIVTEEPEVQQEEQKTLCSLTIKCNTVFDNLDKLKNGKAEIIPQNGIMYENNRLTFQEGETVLDVVVRETKNNNIDIDYTTFGSAYIRSIGSLAEFDCGGQSGWLYRVNGEVANLATNQYVIKNGDIIELIYSCKLGKDI
ncbi:MAG: DUF4430 domain-containing protein [Clostridia bacterium]|nr:DUF4430 domain-containing protein [Clostridia bacterium]